jgi:hypothetical protein
MISSARLIFRSAISFAGKKPFLQTFARFHPAHHHEISPLIQSPVVSGFVLATNHIRKSFHDLLLYAVSQRRLNANPGLHQHIKVGGGG